MHCAFFVHLHGLLRRKVFSCFPPQLMNEKSSRPFFILCKFNLRTHNLVGVPADNVLGTSCRVLRYCPYCFYSSTFAVIALNNSPQNWLCPCKLMLWPKVYICRCKSVCVNIEMCLLLTAFWLVCVGWWLCCIQNCEPAFHSRFSDMSFELV